MKIGDLVIHLIEAYGDPPWTGIIVDIDPLRREIRRRERHNIKWIDNLSNECSEIVIMLSSGDLWHADPKKWEVIDAL